MRTLQTLGRDHNKRPVIFTAAADVIGIYHFEVREHADAADEVLASGTVTCQSWGGDQSDVRVDFELNILGAACGALAITEEGVLAAFQSAGL